MILLLATVLAATANDPPIGSRLGARKVYAVVTEDARARVAAHALAGCMYMKQRGTVRAMLAARDGAAGERLLAKSYPRGTCVNLSIINEDADEQRLTTPYPVMRGLLAEAAVVQDGLGRELAAMPAKRDYAYPWFAATGRPTDMDEMAICVAETDPGAVRGLLATTPGSVAEVRAVGGMGGAIGNCLAAGVKLVGNRTSLRAALADAFYQRAMTPAPQPTGATR